MTDQDGRCEAYSPTKAKGLVTDFGPYPFTDINQNYYYHSDRGNPPGRPNLS